jgi:hypothetical protein
MQFCDGMVTNAALNIYSARDVTGDNQTLRFAAAFITVCSDGDIDDRALLSWPSLPLLYTAGTGVGWLGQAVQGPQYSPANAAGVYVREFQNGYVAVNPRNNGARTFLVPVTTQDVITGAIFAANASISIGDRDGRFLRKI